MKPYLQAGLNTTRLSIAVESRQSADAVLREARAALVESAGPVGQPARINTSALHRYELPQDDGASIVDASELGGRLCEVFDELTPHGQAFLLAVARNLDSFCPNALNALTQVAKLKQQVWNTSDVLESDRLDELWKERER